MDTVQEENSDLHSFSRNAEESLLASQLSVPSIIINDEESSSRRCSEPDNSRLSSRRPSAIIAALRRPSQAIALSAAQAVMNQRRYIMRLFTDHNEESELKKSEKDVRILEKRRKNLRLGDDALTIILSALYAKLLVVLGMAFPTIQIISSEVKSFSSRGFYLYLYIGSIAFVAYIYATLFREKAVVEIINSYNMEKTDVIRTITPSASRKFGSFYLRLGAIAFGIGSMVYSGLEFGRYFDLKDNPECETTILQAITPATRMLLTLVQVQFMFLNSKNVDFNKQKIVARFGLMHMVATNVCEWLNVLVEETKHEIMHLSDETSSNSTQHCTGHVMTSLVSNSSPFLFPCTIEYSLICAVILFEMWKDVKMQSEDREGDRKVNFRNLAPNNKVATNFQFNLLGNRLVNSDHHYTIDCSNSHKGLFAGIMVIVLTIISLIMFFVLTNNNTKSEQIAIFEVNIVELILYVVTTSAVLIAILKLRNLKYDRKIDHEGNNTGIGLDCTLLVVAQTGMFIYCMFSIIGCYFSKEPNSQIELATEIVSFVQTCVQTIFVLDGWWRRCKNINQGQIQPGRQMITFLIVANMAMWTINSLEKNRAEFRPGHLEFYGRWGWTIITHVSMPLAIFYRFHSTICLFEIWKTAYKIKTPCSSYFP
ncbi:unnamed protein product [Phaedon cochleariae]|uniref:Uncharacterized protein n=1 Tax=Phaedon cochleariae TaxID=80249 RepID=A0A9P0DRW6_PHACE|nr:unnamed protein product [Phaedon cochleariae]